MAALPALSARPLSLLVFDIDRFKFINDTLGHDAGDRALIFLGNLANENKRPSDILARIGGDEFVLLLPETAGEQACVLAERLRETVAQSKLGGPGATMKITISIGAATATVSISGIERLIKCADEALYAAKAAGRNRVKLAETDSDLASSDSMLRNSAPKRQSPLASPDCRYARSNHARRTTSPAPSLR
jgi:diguanylate cyclase (GGDEF)-like protein